MTTLTLVLFILLLPLCLFLIGLILLQGGAGDISSAFGGGGQLDSTLGVGAGRKMSKITGWLSGSFMAIVLLLSIQHAGDFGKAAGEKMETPAALPVGNDGQTAPVAPPTPPTPPTEQAPVVVPTAEGTAPQPTTPATTAPAATAPAVEQPAAPAPVAPAAPAPAATEQPAAPAPAATQPVAPAAEQPVSAPAAPRSGITLDEPAK